MAETPAFESVPPPDREKRLREVVRQTRAALGDLRNGVEHGFAAERDPVAAEAVLRATIAQRAAGYVGKVFETKPNRGDAIKNFMPDGKDGLAWCAAFATFCLEQSYVAAGIPAEHQLFSSADRMSLLSARALLERTKKMGTFRTSGPQPGDLVFFRANTRSGVHVALVTELHGSKFLSAEGNVDADPDPRKRREGVGSNLYAVRDPKLMGFASALKGPVST